jgi:hypothetical protein
VPDHVDENETIGRLLAIDVDIQVQVPELDPAVGSASSVNWDCGRDCGGVAGGASCVGLSTVGWAAGTVLAATLSLEADFRSRASSILSENEGPAAGAVCAGDGMVAAPRG